MSRRPAEDDIVKLARKIEEFEAKVDALATEQGELASRLANNYTDLKTTIDSNDEVLRQWCSEATGHLNNLLSRVRELEEDMNEINLGSLAALRAALRPKAPASTSQQRLGTRTPVAINWRNYITPKINNIDARCYDLEGDVNDLSLGRVAAPSAPAAAIASGAGSGMANGSAAATSTNNTTNSGSFDPVATTTSGARQNGAHHA